MNEPDSDMVLEFARKEAGNIPGQFRIDASKGTGDSYSVEKRENGWLVTASNARSCLYGVYHVMAGKPAGNFSAAFPVRGLNMVESLSRHTSDEVRCLIDRMGKWRMNYLVVHTAYGWQRHKKVILDECRKRGIEITYYTYSSLAFLKGCDPAFFSKDADGKPYTARLECETRLCLAHEEGLRYYGAGVEKYLRENPKELKRILIATADGYTTCKCEFCRPLSPIEQWQPLFDAFVNRAKSLMPEIKIESLIYVQRYSLPQDMTSYGAVEGICFDTHQRCRWRPLGEAHPPVPNREGEVDTRAINLPLNVYLADRLRDWRKAFKGRMYVHENLMIQSTLSCPQPITNVLLRDLDLYRRIGVEGVVYEAYEPGIKGFLRQINVLAGALWEPALNYEPSHLERWYTGPDDRERDRLHFFKSAGFDWDAHAGEIGPVLREYLKKLDRVIDRFMPGDVAGCIDYVYENKEHFDRLYIGHWLLQRMHERGMLAGLEGLEQDFLSRRKPWDFMEDVDDPIGCVDSIIMNIRRRL